MTEVAPYWVPEVNALRGGFFVARSINPDPRKTGRKSTRLMDFCIATAEKDDCEYFAPCVQGEFAVVDFMTDAKAWFQWPDGMTPEQISSMVDSCFNARSRRVSGRLWIA